MVEPQANEAYVDTKVAASVAASVAAEATRAQTAEKSLSDRIDTKQAALDASQVTALNSGINAQRVFDIVSLAGSDSNSGKSVRDIAAEEVAKVVANAPQGLDTLKEIADYIESDKTGAAQMVAQIDANAKAIAKKVDAEEGKGLSTKDYTAAEQEKLAGIEDGAQKNPDLSGYAKKTELKLKRDKADNTAAADEVCSISRNWVCSPSKVVFDDKEWELSVKWISENPEDSDSIGWVICFDGEPRYGYTVFKDREATTLTWQGSDDWPVHETVTATASGELLVELYTKSGEPYVTPTGVKNIAIPKYGLVKASIEDGKVTVAPYSITEVTVDDSVSELTFVFPEKTKGQSRDFFVRLVVTGETPPTLSFIEPNGDAVSFDVDDDSWADIEQGVNILMFTDTAE
jgi:hypothetical protein